jgi:hypothetical protein
MMQTEKYGCWQVEGQKFLNKYDALVYATNHNKNVKFYYHNHVWASFDRKKLGKVSLQELYRQRAQQLRDTYDYLVLYYSGGADSHNILRTFIDNNIKIDEICVKWPKQLIDGNFYTPNTSDTSARNYWSEWNYAVKPTLEWISTHKNDIKITIKDYAESIDKLNIDSIISKLNFIRGGGILLNSVISDSDVYITNKNKKIAHIYGIDKPLLYMEDTRIYMFFSDVCLDQAGRGDIDPTNTECFYWTPDFPELPFEQAYQLSLYYKKNPQMKKFLWDNALKTPEEKSTANQFQTELARNLLYDNWDHRFQADKPNSASRTDKFFWFYEHSELADLRNKYFHNIDSRTSTISNTFLTPKTTSGPRVYNVSVSKNFFVTDIR